MYLTYPNVSLREKNSQGLASNDSVVVTQVIPNKMQQ